MNYIKVSSLNGRMGHQLAEWNTALVVAQYYGMKFIHTPLHHGWECALNFGKDEALDVDPSCEIVNLPKFDRANIEEIRPLIEGRNNTLFLLHERQNLENHWGSESILKSKWMDSPINRPFTSGFNVGIHIRRGDVNQDRYPQRWVSNSEYLSILQNHLGAGKDFKLHIFSEGEPEDFVEFSPYRPTLHLGQSEFETFNKMVKCDVLITGKSGYSYFASIISPGEIIAIPFWHEYPSCSRVTLVDS